MKKKTGRFWLASIGLASLILIAAGFPAAHALDKVKAVIPQNSVFVLNWQGAKDAGVFTKHGIDLEVDVRPFAGYLAGIPSKEAKATTYSGIDAIAKMNEGLNLAVIGGGLTVFQDVFVRKDLPIKTIADLRGKKFGVWSSGAGAYKATRVAILESDGFDIAKDATLVQLAPPALFKLLERGEIDAMLNISTFTINAFAQPDKYRPIFSANEYWKKKTGYPIVWSAPIVAWKDWVEENPTRAKNFAAATEELFSMVARSRQLRCCRQEVRHAGRCDHTGSDRDLQEAPGRKAHLPGALGPEGRRCRMAVPGTGQEARRPERRPGQEAARPGPGQLERAEQRS